MSQKAKNKKTSAKKKKAKKPAVVKTGRSVISRMKLSSRISDLERKVVHLEKYSQKLQEMIVAQVQANLNLMFNLDAVSDMLIDFGVFSAEELRKRVRDLAEESKKAATEFEKKMIESAKPAEPKEATPGDNGKPTETSEEPAKAEAPHLKVVQGKPTEDPPAPTPTV
jgi:polyhydroxyalkanoate synthesis regulator phasin